MLQISHHAIEQFLYRWRPDFTYEAAAQLLGQLVARGAPTRRNTTKEDSKLFVTVTDQGEHIWMAVRDHTVVTVFDKRHVDSRGMRRVLGNQEETLLAIDEQRAIASARAATARAREDRLSAERIVSEWKRGADFPDKVLKRARAILGLRKGQMARVRVEGGRFHGLCVEIRDGETLQDAIARFTNVANTGGAP